MKTILLLYGETRSSKPTLQNVAGSKMTQRWSEGAPGCNCDRWGHPFPNRCLREPGGSGADSNHNAAVECGDSEETSEAL